MERTFGQAITPNARLSGGLTEGRETSSWREQFMELSRKEENTMKKLIFTIMGLLVFVIPAISVAQGVGVTV